LNHLRTFDKVKEIRCQEVVSFYGIIFFENEFNIDLLPEPLARNDRLVKISLKAGADLRSAPEEALFIASTDSSLKAAKGAGLAVAAYKNPLFPGQKFEGAGMIIEGFEEVDGDFLERVYRRERGIPWEIAVTKRCIIREFAMTDLPGLTELYNKPGITRNSGGFLDPLLPPEEERRFQESYIANMYGFYGYGMWIVTDKITGEIIGRAGLEHRDFGGETELEIGYIIAPEHQKKGLAAEVCRAIISFAGDNLDFTRINALTDPENTASIALLNRLNFSYLENVPVNGKILQRYVRLLALSPKIE
jgi:RimJ/RimL family protein N-acetyltransferase